MTRIAVLGAGAWGLTLADLLAGNGHAVSVWDRNAGALEVLRRDRTRGKPPGLRVRESVAFEPDFEKAAGGAEVIVGAVPSFAVRAMCERLRALPGGFGGERLYISCSKGIEEETLLLSSQVFADVLGEECACRFGVLSGPSHAEEVCRRLPTMSVGCGIDMETAQRVQDLFMTPFFRVYTQTDCLGVELGGALKNVIAIGAGICDGLGYGDNTKAALITRGIAEMARAAEAMGARPQTLSGLAGLGDLIVTAMSRHSRNRLFGELLARGRTVPEALEEVGAVVEGYRTCRSAHGLSRKLGVEMPLVDTIHAVLYEGASLEEAQRSLLEREPKPEIY